MDEEYNEQELDRFESRFFGAMPQEEAHSFDAELLGDAGMKERYELFVLSLRGIRSIDAVSSLHQGLRQADVGSIAHSRDPEVGGVEGLVPQGPEAETLREKRSKVSQGPETETLRERLRAIDEELDTRPTVVRSILRPWMGWAAAAAVLIGIAGAWWFTNGETPQQLADEFAIAEPGLPVLMGTCPRAMDAIMNAYKQEDFAVAAGLINASLERDPMNDTLIYFAGIMAMRMNDRDGAVAHWNLLDGTLEFEARARYNESILSLRAGDVLGARMVLQDVIKTHDVQVSAKARELLLRLENM